jgi:hypothetical protein
LRVRVEFVSEIDYSISRLTDILINRRIGRRIVIGEMHARQSDVYCLSCRSGNNNKPVYLLYVKYIRPRVLYQARIIIPYRQLPCAAQAKQISPDKLHRITADYIFGGRGARSTDSSIDSLGNSRINVKRDLFNAFTNMSIICSRTSETLRERNGALPISVNACAMKCE